MEKLTKQGSFDNQSNYSASTMRSFDERDFQLPDLEARNAANLDEIKASRKQRFLRKSIQFEIDREKNLLNELDQVANAPIAEFGERPGIVDRPLKLKIRKGAKEAEVELNLLHYAMKRKPGEWKDEMKVLEEIIEGTYEGNDAEEIIGLNSLDHPRLGSVDEKKEDLRQESIEHWCKRHGKGIHQKYTNREKRLLRKWFQALDYDGSGEVNVEELQDPMLSSGILKTREQVVRVLANADKNNTMGIDFEEFLLALGTNKLADQRKLKKLQQMSADPHFDTDTLIGVERRNKLVKSILKRCEERQNEIDKLYKKYDKPKLTKREKDMFHIERDTLEEEHAKSIYLHMKYVAALDGVIEEKKRFYVEQAKAKELSFEEKINQMSSMDMYRTISHIRFGTDQLGSSTDISKDNARPNSRQDMMKKMEVVVATGGLLSVNTRSRGSAIAIGLQMQRQEKEKDRKSSQAGGLFGQTSNYSGVKSSLFSETVSPFRNAFGGGGGNRPHPLGQVQIKSHYDLADNHFKLFAPKHTTGNK